MTSGVADRRELGISGFAVGLVPVGTSGEVVGDVTRFQPCRVNGGQGALIGQEPLSATSLEQLVHEVVGLSFLEQSSVRRAQGGEVGDFRQPDDLPKIGPLQEHLMEAPVVQLQELFDDQAGHQLGLRELARTLGTRVVRQALAGQLKGQFGDGQGALCGFHNPLCTNNL